jgi:branched-chain amino acid transport system substrate-binding protein
MSNNGRRLTARGVVIASVVLLALSGCQKIRTEETYQIGAVLPLTGNIAFLGEPVKKAMDMAVQDINGGGGISGKPLEIIYEDSKGDPKAAVTAMNKLTTVDKVPMVVRDRKSTRLNTSHNR